MKDDRELEIELDIDPNALDRECVKQPRLRRYYGRLLADARRDVAVAKADRDLTEAELRLKIRTKPNDYDLEKITEAAVGETVLTQPGYKRAARRVIDSQHEVDVLAESAVAAIDHRKKSLEDLVQLQLAGYYAEPRLPAGGGREAVERAVWRKGSRK